MEAGTSQEKDLKDKEVAPGAPYIDLIVESKEDKYHEPSTKSKKISMLQKRRHLLHYKEDTSFE